MPASSPGRAGPKILIRLPDLRQSKQDSGWKRWLGSLFSFAGGSGLAAAGQSGSRIMSSPPSQSDLTDPANVARMWSVYQKFRPLIQYVVAHPKTIASASLAAAAQFAAMVAWHESGKPAAPPAAPVEQVAPVVTRFEPSAASYRPAIDPRRAQAGPVGGMLPAYMAARPVAPVAKAVTDRVPGVAILENQIIPATPRELLHESQPSVH